MTNTVDDLVKILKAKLPRIIGMEVDNVNPGNDGGPGDTFEALLGVKINNLKVPDFGGLIELKTGKVQQLTKSASSSYLTLFHRNPDETNGQATNPLIIKALGWTHTGLCSKRSTGGCKPKQNGHILTTDPLYRNGTNGHGSATGRCYPDGELSFRSTTSFSPTARGLHLDFDGDDLVMRFEPSKIQLHNPSKDAVSQMKNPRPTYQDWLNDVQNRSNPHWTDVFPVRYNLQSLYSDYKTKLANSLFVTWKAMSRDGRKQGTSPSKIMFLKAMLLGDPVGINEFKRLLSNDVLVVDFDQRTRHDHGTKLRLHPDNIPVLFNKVEQIS